MREFCRIWSCRARSLVHRLDFNFICGFLLNWILFMQVKLTKPLSKILQQISFICQRGMTSQDASCLRERSGTRLHRWLWLRKILRCKEADFVQKWDKILRRLVLVDVWVVLSKEKWIFWFDYFNCRWSDDFFVLISFNLSAFFILKFLQLVAFANFVFVEILSQFIILSQFSLDFLLGRLQLVYLLKK